MANPFIGEIRIFAGSYPPMGWFFCQGQELQVNQFAALYSIIGNTYGGNPPNTFKLPDLRGNAPLGWGQGPGLTPHALGQKGGAATVALTASQMPCHMHTVQCVSNPATVSNPSNGIWAKSVGTNLYSPDESDAAMSNKALSSACGSVGGTVAHNNMQPYLGINFIISYDG